MFGFSRWPLFLVLALVSASAFAGGKRYERVRCVPTAPRVYYEVPRRINYPLPRYQPIDVFEYTRVTTLDIHISYRSVETYRWVSGGTFIGE